MEVKVINLSNQPLPAYESRDAAGMDVRVDFSRVTPENPIKVYGSANFDFETKTITLDPMSRAMLPSGLKVEIPEGYQISIRPRSGLSFKSGITLCNAVSTIDADYRGEMMLPVINLSTEPVKIQSGERIAQLLLEEVHTIRWSETKKLSKTDRNDGGFGSTGK